MTFLLHLHLYIMMSDFCWRRLTTMLNRREKDMAGSFSSPKQIKVISAPCMASMSHRRRLHRQMIWICFIYLCLPEIALHRKSFSPSLPLFLSLLWLSLPFIPSVICSRVSVSCLNCLMKPSFQFIQRVTPRLAKETEVCGRFSND